MPTLMEWTERLDIGVPDMNAEHKQLLFLMNKLYEADQTGRPKNDISNLLTDLGRYTIKHFTDEEGYLDSIGFPDAAKHKIIHQSLLKKFQEFQEQFDSSGILAKGFFDFLQMWLSAHIQGIDSKYGDFARDSKKKLKIK